MPPTTSPVPYESRSRHILAAALYLGCLVGVAGIIYPFVVPDTPAAAGAIALPPATDDPLFSLTTLPAGKWAVVVEAAPDANVEWQENLRDAVGTVSNVERTGLSLPGNVTLQAVRRDDSGRITALITACTDKSAVTAYWRSTGWTIHEREIDDGRLYRLTHGDRTAIVWMIPTDTTHRLLIALPQPGAYSTGGYER